MEPSGTRRLIQCDPLPGPTAPTGWGWACQCGAHDDGYTTQVAALEVAEHHRRTTP